MTETIFVARNTGAPREAWPEFRSGQAAHGLTDGRWSMIDALEEIIRRVGGPAGLIVSTWTAASADIDRAKGLLENRRLDWARWLVDRSFQQRQPAYCDQLRARFGDGSVRVWNSHAKFAIVIGPEISVLYLTSANLNLNRRLENWTIHWGGPLVDEYLRLVNDAFEAQRPGEGFIVSDSPRRLTRRCLGAPPEPEAEPDIDPDIDLLRGGGEPEFR